MSDYDASGYSNVSNAFPAAIAVVSEIIFLRLMYILILPSEILNLSHKRL